MSTQKAEDTEDGREGSQTVKVETAARILGIGRQTAYQLAREGKLPGARRLGRRIVVSLPQLEDYLKGAPTVPQPGMESPGNCPEPHMDDRLQ